jgi:hypothetical protein
MADMTVVEPDEAVPTDFEVAFLTTEYDTDIDLVVPSEGIYLYIYTYIYIFMYLCLHISTGPFDSLSTFV